MATKVPKVRCPIGLGRQKKGRHMPLEWLPLASVFIRGSSLQSSEDALFEAEKFAIGTTNDFSEILHMQDEALVLLVPTNLTNLLHSQSAQSSRHQVLYGAPNLSQMMKPIEDQRVKGKKGSFTRQAQCLTFNGSLYIEFARPNLTTNVTILDNQQLAVSLDPSSKVPDVILDFGSSSGSSTSNLIQQLALKFRAHYFFVFNCFAFSSGNNYGVSCSFSSSLSDFGWISREGRFSAKIASNSCLLYDPTSKAISLNQQPCLVFPTLSVLSIQAFLVYF